jgi:serine protease Do
VELARILAGLERQIAPRVVALRAAADAPADASAAALDVPAVRIGTDRAMALVGSDRSAERFGMSPQVEGVIAIDAPRGLALIKVLPDSTPALELGAEDALAAPGYAASIDVGPHGPGIRPFYYGRVDRETDARWGQPVLRFSSLQQTPPAGSAIFLLDGRFVGLGAPDERGFVVVPADALRDAVARLEAEGSVTIAEIGVEVAPLTGELQAALSVPAGVVVAHVMTEGPAARSLEPGDVIQRIDGSDVRTVDDYASALARARAGQAVAIEARRHGESVTASIVPVSRMRISEEPSRQLGLDLRPLRGAGAEVVRVIPRGAAALAGVLTGDVITLVDRVQAPAPAAIERAFANAGSPGRLIVGVQRGRRHLVLVLSKP